MHKARRALLAVLASGVCAVALASAGADSKTETTVIQAASPVDSYAAPEPSPEPGYTDEVIMASGSFTQGSTIELSCDGPLREPYTCYLQGGLNFAASRAGVLLAVQNAYFKD